MHLVNYINRTIIDGSMNAKYPLLRNVSQPSQDFLERKCISFSGDFFAGISCYLFGINFFLMIIRFILGVNNADYFCNYTEKSKQSLMPLQCIFFTIT